MGVVADLEVVDIDHHHHEAPPGAGDTGYLGLNLLGEATSIE